MRTFEKILAGEITQKAAAAQAAAALATARAEVAASERDAVAARDAATAGAARIVAVEGDIRSLRARVDEGSAALATDVGADFKALAPLYGEIQASEAGLVHLNAKQPALVAAAHAELARVRDAHRDLRDAIGEQAQVAAAAAVMKAGLVPMLARMIATGATDSDRAVTFEIPRNERDAAAEWLASQRGEVAR